jgi:hypothetical protein
MTRVVIGTGTLVLFAAASTVACGGGADTGEATGTGGVVGAGATFGTGGATGTGATVSNVTGSGGATFGTGGVLGGNGGIVGGTAGIGAGTGGGSVGFGTGGSGTGGGMSGTGGSGTGGSGSGTGGSGTGGMTTTGGAAGMSGAAGGGAAGGGSCCNGGDCLCHGPDPTGLTSKNGPYKTATLTMTTGTVYYPTDAEPPLAGVSICPGFLNTGPEMAPWGPFYASWGIVTVVTSTGAADLPNVRGQKLVAAIEELKKQNTMSGSPLSGKLAGRYGTSGYSMGGGGTTFASEADPTYKTSVGLAAWGPDGATVKTPTLFICSDADTVASCSGTNTSYAAIPSPTPKMILDIPNETHFNWFSPTDAGMGESGAYALAFQKVFLEGDTRWKPMLMKMPTSGTTKMANIM